MPVLTKGLTFANGEQLTAEKLNVLVDEASFNSSTAVDNSTTRVSASGAITVKPQGITSTELAADAVTSTKIATSAVTKAKIENVANMKVLGNTSGSATAPQEVSILDEDDMSSDSATALATQQSIKAYVDDNGITQTSGTAPYYGVRAFGAFDGSTTPPTIIASGNVASVTRLDTGTFKVTLTTAMPNGTNYAVISNEDHHINTTYATSTTVSIQSSSEFNLITGSASSLFNSRYVGFMVIA